MNSIRESTRGGERLMGQTVVARFVRGRLEPLERLQVEEGQEVLIRLSSPPTTFIPPQRVREKSQAGSKTSSDGCYEKLWRGDIPRVVSQILFYESPRQPIQIKISPQDLSGHHWMVTYRVLITDEEEDTR